MTSPLTQPSAHSDLAQETATDFSIVIVCMNNKKYLEPCLRSLYDARLSHRFDTVVTDNGSTDGTQVMLREKFPAVRLIQNYRNVGLSRASNQGIQATCGRYVLLLNDDTLVNGQSLDAMIDFINTHPDVGALGGKLLNPDGSFQSGYASFSSLTQEFLIATRLGLLVASTYPSHGDSDKVKAVDWLSSACLLLRRAALDQVGLLDEDYFIYGDEADLQYRLKQARWMVYYLPFVSVVHFGGRSLNRWRRRKMVSRGKMLFYKKNYGVVRTSILRIMMALLSLAKLATWSFLSLFARWRANRQEELSSNLDVLRLCWRLD